ncbi:MAG: HAMP domain-containing protein, partial [Anaerolineae bacterium]|nr:HAMP domain-containing protein [Anaerolineae bacterium]
MQQLRNLSLRTRLLAGFLWPVFLITFLSYNTVTMTRNLGAEYEAVAAYDIGIISALDELKYYGARVISSTNELILDYAIGREEAASEELDSTSELAQVEESTTSLWDALGRYQTLIAADPNQANIAINDDLAASIEEAAQTLVDDSNRVIALQATEADLDNILEVRTDFEAAEIVFLDVIDRATAHELQDLAVRRQGVSESINQSLTAVTALALSAILLIIAISNFSYRAISKPLAQLQRAALEFSRGNLDVRTGIESNDELGQVAYRFDHMAQELQISINELEAQTIDAVLAREQAERSDRVKSQFLASVSHELRTPLNAVLNFTQFVASGMMGEVNERQVDALNKVYNSGSHLLDLINDVLDIS